MRAISIPNKLLIWACCLTAVAGTTLTSPRYLKSNQDFSYFVVFFTVGVWYVYLVKTKKFLNKLKFALSYENLLKVCTGSEYLTCIDLDKINILARIKLCPSFN